MAIHQKNTELREAQTKLQEQQKQVEKLNEENKKLQDENKEIDNLKKQLEAKVPSTKPTRNVTVYSKQSTVEQWRSLVAKYAWPVEEALLVMKLESGGNPNAVSSTDDHGLYQIHGGYARYGEQIYNPEFNISLAYNHYYKNRKWTPWYAVRGILWNS